MTYEEAQAEVRDNPNNADAWFVLGKMAEAAGHTTQAISSYRRALALDSFKEEALEALTHLQEERVLEQARNSLKKWDVEGDPRSASLTNNVARSTYVRWLLLGLLILSLALVALTYLNFGGL
jgi:cytochrome c-type biogenesis protein CcmH/NrfG